MKRITPLSTRVLNHHPQVHLIRWLMLIYPDYFMLRTIIFPFLRLFWTPYSQSTIYDHVLTKITKIIHLEGRDEYRTTRKKKNRTTILNLWSLVYWWALLPTAPPTNRTTIPNLWSPFNLCAIRSHRELQCEKKFRHIFFWCYLKIRESHVGPDTIGREQIQRWTLLVHFLRNNLGSQWLIEQLVFSNHICLLFCAFLKFTIIVVLPFYKIFCECRKDRDFVVAICFDKELRSHPLDSTRGRY